MIASAKEVEQTRALLEQYLRPTRLVSAESLSQHSAARVYLKIESDLPTGTFKVRGALNALLTTAAQRALPGVVAADPATTAPQLPTPRGSRRSAPRFFCRRIRIR